MDIVRRAFSKKPSARDGSMTSLRSVSQVGGSSSRRVSQACGSGSRRSSIFTDLLFLLRRSSGSVRRLKLEKNYKNRDGEAEAFLQHNPTEKDEDDDPMTRDQLLAKIREKKEVIEKLRCQPWPMQRKRRTLKLAQKYLQRHESKVSRTHLYKEEVSKTIADRFTSRLNNTNKSELYAPRKFLVQELDKRLADEIQVIWDFRGYIEKSALFYGYYSNESRIEEFNYNLPLSYLLINLLILGYSFFAILRKMASNARLSKLSSGKTEQYQFAWKLFTGWDFSIGHSETASNAVMANVNKFKEAITDFKTKLKRKFEWILILRRILANLLIFGMIAGSAYAIQEAVNNSKFYECKPDANVFQKNEVPIVVSFITLVYPNIFEVISKVLERVHPRTALRMQLGRILILYLLNFYTLIWALFNKIEQLEKSSSSNSTLTPCDALLLPKSTVGTGVVISSVGHMIITNITTTTATPIGHLATTAAASTLNSLSMAVPIPMLQYFQKYLKNRTSNNLVDGTTTVSYDYNNDNNNNNVENRRKKRNAAIQRRNIVPEKKIDAKSKRQTVGNEIYSNYDYWTSTNPTNEDIAAASDRVHSVRFVSQEATAYPPYYGTVVINPKAFLKEVVNASLDEVNQTLVLETFPITTPTSRTFTEPPGVVVLPVPPKNPDEATSRKGDELDYQKAEASKFVDRRGDVCWETLIGQEICKLITMDLVMSIISILLVDFFRGLWVRYCNRWWCWNLERYFPEYGEFKVAENVLHLINNQGMIWLGVFFSPLLPAVNIVKMIILLYIRAWAVVTCNVPATQVFRASRSSNFYLILLLLMLFLCTLPVGYVIVQKDPSKTCGPFGGKTKYYSIFVEILPTDIYGHLDYVASPGIVIPVLVLLILVVYFLVSLIRGLREANQDLQKQLIHERTEEKRKIYQMAGKKNELNRASLALPDTKKVDVSYLPLNEKKRREAWRPKLTLTDSIVEDEKLPGETGDYSPSLSGCSPTTPSRPLVPPELVIADASSTCLYRPSLKSLPEEVGVPMSDLEDDNGGPGLERSKSDSVLKSNYVRVPGPILASVEDDLLLSMSSPSSTRSATLEDVSSGRERSVEISPLIPPLSPPLDQRRKMLGEHKLDLSACYHNTNLKPFAVPPLPYCPTDKNLEENNYFSSLTPPNVAISRLNGNVPVANGNGTSVGINSSDAGDELTSEMLADMISPTKFDRRGFESMLGLREPLRPTPIDSPVRGPQQQSSFLHQQQPKFLQHQAPNVLIRVCAFDSDLEKGTNPSSSETSGTESYCTVYNNGHEQPEGRTLKPRLKPPPTKCILLEQKPSFARSEYHTPPTTPRLSPKNRRSPLGGTLVRRGVERSMSPLSANGGSTNRLTALGLAGDDRQAIVERNGGKNLRNRDNNNGAGNVLSNLFRKRSVKKSTSTNDVDNRDNDDVDSVDRESNEELWFNSRETMI